MVVKDWTIYARRSCASINIKALHSTYKPAGYEKFGVEMTNTQAEAVKLAWDKFKGCYPKA